MIQAIETTHLSKRYGRKWSLQDCTLQIPIGSVTALVGPNGAGKTTLLSIAAGLLGPSAGTMAVLGLDPIKDAKKLLPRIGFVSQDHPLYKSFTVRDMLTLGSKLNPQWQPEIALKRLERLGIPLKQAVGRLSGGQQAQVALLLALAKQPEVLILDEPVASLDPLARREFQQTLMDAVAEHGLTVIIASHIIADLERFCDYVVILSVSRVQISSAADHLLESHKLLIGPHERAESISKTHTVLSSHEAGRQATLLVHTQGPILDPVWEVRSVSLEDIVLSYLTLSNTVMSDQDNENLETVR